jgi:C-terminal processing protease CtpA/Prc
MRSNALLCLALALLFAPAPVHAARADKSRVLTFEAIGSAKPLGEWIGYPAGFDGTFQLDSTVVHEGRYAGRIDRDSTRTTKFSALALYLPVDFPGDSIELRGWLKFENVVGTGGLWQRQDGKAGMVQFDNMQSRGLNGTRDWTEYRLALPRDAKARTVVVGAILQGTGRLWADDLRVFVDGKPLAQAPEIVPPKTVLDTDTTFVAGSRIDLTQPTPVQAENLALLGKVWGFLKYHHPAVVAGRRHWDFDLFRVMPRVLAARDRGEACDELARWVDSLGAVPPCSTCAKLPSGRPVAPRLGWLADRALLGAELSRRLGTIYERRPKVDGQFYVSLAPGVGNPDFGAELAYANLKEPDAGYRLLALFRFWNMVEYWFPDRDVMDEDWDATLLEFVPRLAHATTHDTYATEMMALIARVHDTHANLWSSLTLRVPRGRALAPARIRFVEGRAVVTGWSHPKLGPACGLAIGDVVESVDGVAVQQLVERWRPMYAASNEPTRLRDIGERLTRGDAGPTKLVVSRDGRELALEVARVPEDSLDLWGNRNHDRPGPAFRRLSDDVAYLRLGPAKRDSVESYFARAAGAKLLVLDHRNYPSDFPIFAIGGHLVSQPTPFVKFTVGDASNPGSFDWNSPLKLEPVAPRFEGAVAILVDEVTQSSAEYHSLAFRASPGALVVGSTTAGADGNISPIQLPGGLRTMFSGIGVFWPDGRPTQRVGIVPDVPAAPTIAGIKAGRDEVLEAAVRRVLHREMTPAEYGAYKAEPAPPQ